jgi:hypothetical protein
MREFLQPVVAVHPPPAGPDATRYVRSNLIMRVLVGVIGIGLPFALVLLDGLWFDGDPFPRDSLSAYYYSGARELFAGALSATGVFLLTYKVAERNLDLEVDLLRGG